MKILCIDDDKDDSFLIRQSIRELSDIEIENAYDGEQALAVLARHKISRNLPSLIVLDLNMPGMDGKKTLQAIKKDQALKNIPLVVFTTSLKGHDKEFIESEQIETIIKPTDWSSYKAIASKLLNYCR
jgi:CheY-like chemotaxis protein